MFDVLSAVAFISVSNIADPIRSETTISIACTIDYSSRATMTGFDDINENFRYEQVFLIDKENRTVTTLYGLDPEADRPRRIERTSVHTDIRSMDDSRIVFCMTSEVGCRTFEETIQGTRVRTTQELSVLDLSRMTYSYRERRVMIRDNGNFTYDASFSGRCRYA